MAQISKYLRNVAGGGLTFWCQGCKKAHTVWVGAGVGERWTWNGDVEKPVFGPSVLVTYDSLSEAGQQRCRDFHAQHGRYPTVQEVPWDVHNRCHTFVGCNGAQPGEIIFLGDCTHELAGQTLPLAALPPYMSRDA